MWTGVGSRKHTPRNVYVQDDNANDLMLFGELLYGLENGKRVSIDFSARIIFGKFTSLTTSQSRIDVRNELGEGEESMKIQRYQVGGPIISSVHIPANSVSFNPQVWLDASRLAAALKE